MKSQIELISYYTKNLEKVSQSHGFGSDYTTYAFFLLQAVKMNIEHSKIFDWAKSKCDSLHEETLELV